MKRVFATILAGVAFAGTLVAQAGPVNVNTADAEALAAELAGIGPALARAIVDDRNKNGLYRRPEDLARVNGIGMSVVEKNRAFILLETSD